MRIGLLTTANASAMSLEFRGIHADFIADETGEIDIEGSRQSGKTWACSAKLVKSCLKFPGIEWLMTRYSGTEVDNKLRPEFVKVARRMGVELDWHDDEQAYWFPPVGDKISKVEAYGLKSQSATQRFAKIRGTGGSGVWNDQAEETPEDIARELRFSLRQEGYPHQLIFSPNPPEEDHWLADDFPDDVDLPGRKYYRLSLYDNKHNIKPEDIARLEQAYPPSHVKHRSLILGLRGPNISGTPIYEHSFVRALHIGPVAYDPDLPILEAISHGTHHPTWLATQRTYFGGLVILGGLIGKRLYLDEFLPIVQGYRAEWFEGAQFKTCSDPPLEGRFSNLKILRDAGFQPRYVANSNAADVREATIQTLAAMMKRRHGMEQAFRVTDDPSRFLMASHKITKQTKYFVDGCEGSYVWDEHRVSVSSKEVRQPKSDEWVEGQQRCLEHIALNFCIGKRSQSEEDAAKRKRHESKGVHMPTGPQSWMCG